METLREGQRIAVNYAEELPVYGTYLGTYALGLAQFIGFQSDDDNQVQLLDPDKIYKVILLS